MFVVPLPQELESGGSLAQQWSGFLEYYRSHMASNGNNLPLEQSSILLYAAQHKAQQLNLDIKNQGMDAEFVPRILQMVEEVCLPLFLLLFERFRFFTLQQLESTSDFVKCVHHQAELCQFGDLQDGLIATALINGTTDEKFRLELQCKGDLGKEQGPLAETKGVRRGKRGRKRKIPFGEDQNRGVDLYLLPVADTVVEDDEIPETKPSITQTRKESASSKRKGSPKRVSQAKEKLRLSYKCFACNKEYKSSKSLRRHTDKKHKSSHSYKCVHCNIKFESYGECLRHCHSHNLKTSKRKYSKSKVVKTRADSSYICWHCGEPQDSLIRYKDHSTTHAASVRVYTCDICQKKSHNITRLIGHLKGHLVPRHRCHICGSCFGRSELLEAHVKNHIDQPDHKCPICEKKFVTADRLTCHLRTHSGEKRFTCELCGKSFSQKMSFDYHKRWHAGEKPYECEICGHKTICYGDLKKHKRSHSDKRPYVCEICGKSFRFISNLNRHRRGHSGKRGYVCQVCGRSFIYNEGLRDHIKAGRCPGLKTEGGAGPVKGRGGRPRNASVLKTILSTPVANDVGFTVVPISANNTSTQQAQCFDFPSDTIFNHVEQVSAVLASPALLSTQSGLPMDQTTKTEAASTIMTAVVSSINPSMISNITGLPSGSTGQLMQETQHSTSHTTGVLPTQGTVLQIQVPVQQQTTPEVSQQHINIRPAISTNANATEVYTGDLAWQQYVIRNSVAVSEPGDSNGQTGSSSSNIVLVPQFYG